MIDISNCPDTGLKRKLDYEFIWARRSLQVIVRCYISHYNNSDILIENARIHSYTRDLIASDSLVHPLTGVLLTDPELLLVENNQWIGPTPITEYEFYTLVLGVTPIVLSTIIEATIALRDSQGKFNI